MPSIAESTTWEAALVVFIIETIACVILGKAEGLTQSIPQMVIVVFTSGAVAVCGLFFWYTQICIAEKSTFPFEWPIHFRLRCIRATYKRMGATRRELEEPKLPSRHDASDERRWAALQEIKHIIEYGGTPSIDHLELLNEEFIEAPLPWTLRRLRALYIEECWLIMLLAEKRIKNSA